MISKINRRRILVSSASALGFAALQRQLRAEGQPPSQLMATLSGYMSAAATRPLPAEVVEKTKHIVIDTFAAMISGSELPPGRFAIQFARAYGGEGYRSRSREDQAPPSVRHPASKAYRWAPLAIG